MVSGRNIAPVAADPGCDIPTGRQCSTLEAAGSRSISDPPGANCSSARSSITTTRPPRRNARRAEARAPTGWAMSCRASKKKATSYAASPRSVSASLTSNRTRSASPARAAFLAGIHDRGVVVVHAEHAQPGKGLRQGDAGPADATAEIDCRGVATAEELRDLGHRRDPLLGELAEEGSPVEEPLAEAHVV